MSKTSLRLIVSFARSQNGSAPTMIGGGTTVQHYAGIDVPLESSSVCVMDAAGRVVREGKLATEPEALVASLRQPSVDELA